MKYKLTEEGKLVNAETGNPIVKGTPEYDAYLLYLDKMQCRMEEKLGYRPVPASAEL